MPGRIAAALGEFGRNLDAYFTFSAKKWSRSLVAILWWPDDQERIRHRALEQAVKGRCVARAQVGAQRTFECLEQSGRIGRMRISTTTGDFFVGGDRIRWIFLTPAGAILNSSRFEVEIGSDVGPIWVHAALVEQAVFNIIENAVAFSPSGELVSVRAVLDATDRLRVEVVDRGPGIPEDERHRVFDMFYSVERGDRGRKGTGLGLSMAYGIVRQSNGHIHVESRPGVGTTFNVFLPLATETA